MRTTEKLMSSPSKSHTLKKKHSCFRPQTSSVSLWNIVCWTHQYCILVAFECVKVMKWSRIPDVNYFVSSPTSLEWKMTRYSIQSPVIFFLHETCDEILYLKNIIILNFSFTINKKYVVIVYSVKIIVSVHIIYCHYFFVLIPVWV